MTDQTQLRAEIDAYKQAMDAFDAELEANMEGASKEEFLALLAKEPKRPPLMQSVLDQLTAEG